MALLTNRLMTYLKEHGIDYEVVHHRTDYTAQQAAADTHTPGRSFAKTVVLTGERGPALIVLSAPDRVDMEKARELLGDDVQLATESQIARLFPDCEVGAEPPFGNLYDVPVYVSPSLAQDAYITFNAGTHNEVVRMRYEDFERLVRPSVTELGQKA